MTIIKSFYTEAEALNYIEKHNLDNVIIDKDIFSGRYNIIDMG